MPLKIGGFMAVKLWLQKCLRVKSRPDLGVLKGMLTSLLVAMSLAAASAAGPLEKGQAAYYRGDYAVAIELMQPLAEQGDTHAQFLIGYMHEKGQGVSQDYAEAAKWYALAGEGGHPFAQNNLGVLYKHGRGVSKDYVQAYKLFDLAASGYLAAEDGHREQAVLNQESVASQMTPEQISEAKKLVEEKLSSDPDFLQYRAPRIR
jgi:tetratricopeptide (TPR) repeat protein